MRDTPLHRDTVALSGVLLESLDAADSLRDRLARVALDLVEDVTLAVAGNDDRRRERLEDADTGLRLLRTHLELSRSLGLFDEGDYLDLAEQADIVGRQIGGWLKSLRSA